MMVDNNNQLCYEPTDYDFNARRRKGKFQDTKIATENLILMKKVLDEHGIQFWLMFGTLLGAIRDKKFIEYDKDTDLGCFIENRDRVIDAIPTLIANGFIFIRKKYDNTLFSFMRNDEYIDIYFFQKSRTFFLHSYWVHLQTTYRIPANHLDKLEKILFIGKYFEMPSNSYILLKRWYGEDWQKPQRNKNAHGTISSFEKIKLKLMMVGGLLNRFILKYRREKL